MNQRTVAIVNISAGVLLGLLIAGQLAFKNTDKKNTDPFITYSPPAIPKQMSFAGEEVPLKRRDVKERMNREILFNYYNKHNILLLLKLTNGYFLTIS